MTQFEIRIRVGAYDPDITCRAVASELSEIVRDCLPRLVLEEITVDLRKGGDPSASFTAPVPISHEQQIFDAAVELACAGVHKEGLGVLPYPDYMSETAIGLAKAIHTAAYFGEKGSPDLDKSNG